MLKEKSKSSYTIAKLINLAIYIDSMVSQSNKYIKTFYKIWFIVAFLSLYMVLVNFKIFYVFYSS